MVLGTSTLFEYEVNASTCANLHSHTGLLERGPLGDDPARMKHTSSSVALVHLSTTHTYLASATMAEVQHNDNA